MPRKITTSDGWMIARETIKGLPEAGEKVGKAIGRGMGIVMKTPFLGIKKTGEFLKGQTRKEVEFRKRMSKPPTKKQLQKIRETIKSTK